MDAMALIQRELAKPMTHVVVTTYTDGNTAEFKARSFPAAESYAKGELRKVGKPLVNRDTLAVVTVEKVEVHALA